MPSNQFVQLKLKLFYFVPIIRNSTVGIFRLCHALWSFKKESIFGSYCHIYCHVWSTSSSLWRANQDRYCWLCHYAKMKREGLVNLTTWFTEQTSNIIMHSRLSVDWSGIQYQPRRSKQLQLRATSSVWNTSTLNNIAPIGHMWNILQWQSLASENNLF